MGKFSNYFIEVFKKDGEHKTKNINTRMMHGVNRISIVMFIIALIVLFYKWFS